MLSWAFADDPYQACREVWEQALKSPYLPDVTKLRFEKKYPESFEYLGWCSWEQYKKNISEEQMAEVIAIDVWDRIRNRIWDIATINTKINTLNQIINRT